MLLQVQNQLDTVQSLPQSSGELIVKLIVILGFVFIVAAFVTYLLFRDRSIRIWDKLFNKTKVPSIPVPESLIKYPHPNGLTLTQQLDELLQAERKKQSNEKRPIEADTIIPPPPAKPKFIGYNPINIFAQTEPLNFPIVIMPKPGCVIKFPHKGKGGRKGYKEADFHQYLTRHFSHAFQLYTDRILSVKGNSNPFAPDFAFIDEKEGVNLFLDVEIDEPYEGLNDLGKRKPTHFQYADTDRNNAFKNRGWIVIRFAEIQIHQDPAGCCLFIADVIASIHPTFKIPPRIACLETGNQRVPMDERRSFKNVARKIP